MCRWGIGLLIRQGFLVHLSFWRIVKKKVGTTTTILNNLLLFLMTLNKIKATGSSVSKCTRLKRSVHTPTY